jgi:hypothetical protein
MLPHLAGAATRFEDPAPIFSDISSHRRGAIKVFPPRASPKFAAPRIVFCHQNIRPFQSRALQTGETFLDQTLAKAASLIRRFHRQMINVPASTIVTAQHCADNAGPVRCDSTQALILFEKSADRFPIVALGNIETFDSVPEFDSGIVIVDSKFPGLNLHRAEILARWEPDRSTRWFAVTFSRYADRRMD